MSDLACAFITASNTAEELGKTFSKQVTQTCQVLSCALTLAQCTDESNYVGDYVRGKRHGYGVYCFPNGDKYAGGWAGGGLNAMGSHRSSDLWQQTTCTSITRLLNPFSFDTACAFHPLHDLHIQVNMRMTCPMVTACTPLRLGRGMRAHGPPAASMAGACTLLSQVSESEANVGKIVA